MRVDRPVACWGSQVRQLTLGAAQWVREMSDCREVAERLLRSCGLALSWELILVPTPSAWRS